MELIKKSMNNLFAQLGEPSDNASIARFIQLHGTLLGSVALHEAPCWSVSQACFLKDALLLDGAWAPVVDALNGQLHATHL